MNQTGPSFFGVIKVGAVHLLLLFSSRTPKEIKWLISFLSFPCRFVVLDTAYYGMALYSPLLQYILGWYSSLPVFC